MRRGTLRLRAQGVEGAVRLPAQEAAEGQQDIRQDVRGRAAGQADAAQGRAQGPEACDRGDLVRLPHPPRGDVAHQERALRLDLRDRHQEGTDVNKLCMIKGHLFLISTHVYCICSAFVT